MPTIDDVVFPDLLLTATQMSRSLKVSKRTLIRWHDEGLPVCWFGNAYRYDPSKVWPWFCANKLKKADGKGSVSLLLAAGAKRKGEIQMNNTTKTKTFTVEITEKVVYSYTVEATDVESAKEIAKAKHDDGEIIPDDAEVETIDITDAYEIDSTYTGKGD